MKKLVKYVGITVGVAAALYALSIVWWIGGIVFELNQNGSNLDKEVAKRKQQLSQITIIDGKKTVAEGVPSGDALTGNVRDVTAEAAFVVSGTLYDQAAQVRKNLESQGFVTTEKPIENVGNSGISSVSQRFYKNDDLLVVFYFFSKTYQCPAEMVCGYGGDKSDIDPAKLYDMNVLAQEPIKAIGVTYGSKDRLAATMPPRTTPQNSLEVK